MRHSGTICDPTNVRNGSKADVAQGAFGADNPGMDLPLPVFVLRFVVRRNPWLLGEGFSTRRSTTLDLGLWPMRIDAEMELLPSQKARLRAEADAGTLFG